MRTCKAGCHHHSIRVEVEAVLLPSRVKTCLAVTRIDPGQCFDETGGRPARMIQINAREPR